MLKCGKSGVETSKRFDVTDDIATA